MRLLTELQFCPTSSRKRPFSNGLFSIQSEGLAWNLTAGEYVIAEGVWHHALACILLRIDYIQHFVLIPYRRQAADFIHGFAVILRVAFLYYEHKQNRVTIWFLAFVFFLVRLKPIIFCLTVVPIPTARQSDGPRKRIEYPFSTGDNQNKEYDALSVSKASKCVRRLC